ncbi:MAG: DUF817 domain-containing protein [Methanobacterium sp.]|nr:DUF817 domain-containing protein [Methanobacterium sp.]
MRPYLRRFQEAAERTVGRATGPVFGDIVRELFCFGFKQLASCLFAGSFLALLVVSSHIRIPGVLRYDFLFLGAVAIQLLLVLFRLESWRDVGVLSLFHLLGVGLELFKTAPSIHSWSYPEPAVFKLGSVPLYSGFMYAAVASYMIQAWRIFNLRLEGFPRSWQAIALCALVYANFFANHYLPDQRWLLGLCVLILFRRSHVHFTVIRIERRMPLALSFLLIGFFIWIAENIATFFGAWVYPHQIRGWAIVGTAKISSWTLLVIISFVIVAVLQRKGMRFRGAAITEPSEKGVILSSAYNRVVVPDRGGPV